MDIGDISVEEGNDGSKNRKRNETKRVARKILKQGSR